MRFSQDFIRKVEDATDLVGLIQDQGVALRKAGTSFKACCPFHNEKTPSFNINPQRGFFHCFGCNVGGGAVKFLMLHERVSFVEAITELARKAGIALEGESGPRKRDDADEGMACLKQAQTFFCQQLREPGGEEARNYLEERKVPTALQERFALGYAPDDWQGLLRHLQTRSIPNGLVVRVGLAKTSERSERPYDRFRNRLIFPIRDPRGRCIAFGGRILGAEDGPKYLNSPETDYYHKSQILYGLYEGLDSIRRSRKLLVVEGYLDVMRLHEYGIGEAVAPCGTALTPKHVQVAERYADVVTLLFDGDEAGRNAALKNARLFLASKAEAQVVTLPLGEDPDTFLLKNGAKAMRDLLADAKPLLEFLVQETLSRMPDSVQGRMRAVEELVPLLVQIPQQDRRQLTLVALADQLKVSPEVLLRKLPESLHSENENAKPIHSAHTESSRTDEWWVVQALLAQGQLWSLARQYLLPEEMQDTRLRHIYSRLMQLPPDLLYPLDPSGVERQDPELHRDLAPLLAEDFLERNLESQFRWSVRRLKERSLKLRYQEKSAGLVEEDRLRAGMELRRLNAQLQQLLPQVETMQAP